LQAEVINITEREAMYMRIPSGVFQIDLASLKLAELIEFASSNARAEGREEDAMELFRLRIRIRERGLTYEEAKVIFDKHAKCT
jgi:hypothetical protein